MDLSRKKSVRCKQCNTKQKADARFCARCGAELPVTEEGGGSAPGEPAKTPGRVRRIAVIVASAVLIITVAAAGTLKVRHDQQVKRERAAKLAAKKKAAAKRKAKFDACVLQQGDLIDALDEINGKLDVGMNFTDYSDAVGDASVAYNKIDFSNSEIDCTGKVGLATEAALNQYMKAARAWNDCNQDIDCDTDDIDLQRYWSKASVKLDSAKSGLSELEP